MQVRRAIGGVFIGVAVPALAMAAVQMSLG
jgi:hypothetical protein